MVLRNTIFSVVIIIIFVIITMLITLPSPPNDKRWKGKKNRGDKVKEGGEMEEFQIPETLGLLTQESLPKG